MLPAAIQAESLRLTYAARWLSSPIARPLGITRQSVQKVAGRRSGALPPAPPAPRTPVVTPFRPRLQALLTEDPTRAAVATLRPTAAPAAFLSRPFGRAEAAQVDWGEFGDVFGTGRTVPVFGLGLWSSRLLPVTCTFSQPLAAFLRCQEQAFACLGGCPKECWYANRATAVAERHGRLVRCHPRFLASAGPPPLPPGGRQRGQRP